MRSAIFSLVCCFLWIGAKAQGQGKLINLGTEAEPVSIQVQSSTAGVLDCEGGLKGFGFRNCKEILAAFSLPERWIMQVQGRKLLVGKLPLDVKFESGMFLIPAELASSLVKCSCQNQVLYSIQGLDCVSGCKALNQDTSIQAANGAGTRSAIPSTRNKPGLRRDGVPQPEPDETTERKGQQTGAERADTNSVNGLRVPPSVRGVVIDKKLFRKDKKGFVQPVSSPGNASGVTGMGEDLTDTLVQEGNGAGNRSAIPSTRNKPGLRSDAPPRPGKEQSTSAQSQTSGQEKGISNQSNQNKPRAEVKTLGDLVSYRTEGDSPSDTVIQKGGGAGTRSAIPSTRNKPGLRRDGVPQPEPDETTERNGQQTGAERADTNSVNGLRVPPSVRGVVIDKKLFRKDKKGFVQPVSSPGNASGVTGMGEDLTDTLVQEGNGAGNRSAIPSTRNKPGLRSDAPPTPGKEQSTSAQSQTSGQEKGTSNQSNQNKPRAEVKTLGDLVSYRTGGDSSQDTIQAKPSLIGLEQEGIHTSTYNSKQNNPKPKQETTTLGEISALAALKTGQSGSAKDTSQIEFSAKGGGKGSGGGNTKPKQETTTLGEISALGALKTGQSGSAKDTSQIEFSAKGGGKGSGGGNTKPKQETTTLGEISALAALKTGQSGSAKDTSQIEFSAKGGGKGSGGGNTKPKQETTTLGEISALAALKTGQSGSAKDTSQIEFSAKGGGKGSGGGNPKPKQETTTLGEISALAALKTGQSGSAKDTSQIEFSAKGGGKGSGGGNPKPKQETTTLGEISALAALKTSTNTPVEAYLEMQANQRQVDFDESFKALISASKRKAIVPAYLVKPNDPLFYTTDLWSRIRQGNDTCFVASKFTAKELVQVGLIYVHVQFLSPSGLPVNEVCIPVKLPASSALQPTSSVLGLALDVQKAVLNSDELKGQQIGTKLFVSERPKPYSFIMPYLTEDIGLFMVSTESGIVLSFSEVPMEESLQQLVLEGFKQSLTLKK